MKFKLNEDVILETSNPNPEENIGGPESDLSTEEEIKIYNASDIIVDDDDDQVFNALNRAYKLAKLYNRDAKLVELGKKTKNNIERINILLVGESGTGKTERVEQWAKRNNLNLVTMNTSNIGPEAVSGVPAPDEMDTPEGKRKVAQLLRTTLFDRLNEPNTVLFLDEYNRGRYDVRQPLLTLIANHVLKSGGDSNADRYFPNLLFVVAAINPSDFSRATDRLDPAEINRFEIVTIVYDLNTYWRYRGTQLQQDLKEYKSLAEEDESFKEDYIRTLNMYNLLHTLVKNGSVGNILHFDTAADRKGAGPETNTFSGRSLDKLLMASEGKKET